MTDAERIALQIERSYAGPMWHGRALTELLTGVSAADAATHPIRGAHSIWELVAHMTEWADIGRERHTLGDAAAGHPSAERDYPPIRDTSESAWKAAIARLAASHTELARAVRAAGDGPLDGMLVGRDHTSREMLHGIVEHDAYHGGQIALLLRALETPAAGTS